MTKTTTHYATCEITADGRAYKHGDVLAVSDGTLQSMLRMGQASATPPIEAETPAAAGGTPLAVLQLPPHIVELLSKADLATVEQLAAAGPKQVSKIPGLGKSSLKTIEDALAAYAAAGTDDDGSGNDAPTN